jgi:hypothetical protein
MYISDRMFLFYKPENIEHNSKKVERREIKDIESRSKMPKATS